MCLAVLLAVPLLLPTTETVTLTGLRGRINMMRQYVDNQASTLQYMIRSLTLNTKTDLNTKAGNLIKDINNGPNTRNCRSYVERVTSIAEKQINFLNTFEACSKYSDILSLRSRIHHLDEVNQQVDKLEDTCTYDCQKEINAIEKGLNEMQVSIDKQVSSINDGSKKCIAERDRKINASLDDVRKRWQKCR